MAFSGPKNQKQPQICDFEAFFVKNGLCKPFQRKKIAKSSIDKARPVKTPLESIDPLYRPALRLQVHWIKGLLLIAERTNFHVVAVPHRFLIDVSPRAEKFTSFADLDCLQGASPRIQLFGKEI